MKSRIEIILDNTPFPGAGQQIGGYKVNESVVDITGKTGLSTYKKAFSYTGKSSIHTDREALRLPVQDEFSLIRFDSKGMTHARTILPVM